MRDEQHAEFRALYDQYALSVYRRVLRLLGNSVDAWDAVQEVFFRVFRSQADFRGEARPMTYLYRIGTNICIDMMRRRAVSRTVPDESPSAPERPDATAEARDLLKALATQLDDRKLSIAALYYVDELSQEKIAEIIGLSRKSVGHELAEVRRIAEGLAGHPEVGHG